MNMYPHGRSGRTVQEIWEDFSMSFTPAVREVVEFAKHIPGFRDLSQHDQVTLLKAGTFEVSDPLCSLLFTLGRIQWKDLVSGIGRGSERLWNPGISVLADSDCRRRGQNPSPSCLGMAGSPVISAGV